MVIKQVMTFLDKSDCRSIGADKLNLLKTFLILGLIKSHDRTYYGSWFNICLIGRNEFGVTRSYSFWII